jgi:hypothetical protein
VPCPLSGHHDGPLGIVNDKHPVFPSNVPASDELNVTVPLPFASAPELLVVKLIVYETPLAAAATVDNDTETPETDAASAAGATTRNGNEQTAAANTATQARRENNIILRRHPAMFAALCRPPRRFYTPCCV